ncbi:SAM-dependent methyltransferase [Olsenella uli]|uniref:SAM-dependent methyltransferase n=1 Tax=Olsenella uli TaxID=133926 RepID=UPI003D7A672B
MTNADSYPSVNLGYGSCPSSSPTRFPKTATFPVSLVREKIMGPNPLKLCEELLTGSDLPHGSRVCDLGSGTGITSALLAREYGLDVYAVDLWSDPAENRAFFDSLGIPVSSIHPVKADASRGLPFCAGFFDAVVSIDSYNYYGRDSRYLDERLLPYVRTGSELHLSIPGMVHDCHDDLPSCLLASWTPEQLEYMHDMAWWKRMLRQSRARRRAGRSRRTAPRSSTRGTPPARR